MLLLALITALFPVVASSNGSQPPPQAVLAVPFLPQTEALCGGASVAMVFRYWGDRRASVQQFEPLVDRRAGGIADNVLIDAVRDRGWQAERLNGSIEMLREHLRAGRPIILLLEDRPGFYHYVVAVGADEEAVYVHDPIWGPARRLPTGRLLRFWRPSNYWALSVRPAASGVPRPTTDLAPVGVASGARSETAEPREPTPCEARLAGAVDAIGEQGLDRAEALLAAVRAACPDSAGPVRELAGVRFAQRRWEEAAAYAEEALALDPEDAYAWDVLGSSRFLMSDPAGALRAWNAIGRPQLDSVKIEGLERTRYALVADALALEPNTLLTADAFRLAERRLRDLPSRTASRLAYRPDSDGFAAIDVAIVERSARPAGPFAWAAKAGGTLVNRELAVSAPGALGQGEVWSASWRWWDERPRVALAFSAPRIGWFPGTWSAAGAWEVQRYAGAEASAPLRETRLHGGVGFAGWLTPDVRYGVELGVDSWNGDRKALSVGGSLERRLAADRVAVQGTLRRWVPIIGPAFQEGGAHLSAGTSTEARGVVAKVRAALAGASAAAPFALWHGAGGGQGRAPLLRGHPLLVGGVVNGPVFGRRLASLSAETEWWLARPRIVRLAVATFVDVGRAWERLPAATGQPFHTDAGVGVRLRLPGTGDTLRIDYGRGLRDGHDAITFGFTVGSNLSF